MDYKGLIKSDTGLTKVALFSGVKHDYWVSQFPYQENSKFSEITNDSYKLHVNRHRRS